MRATSAGSSSDASNATAAPSGNSGASLVTSSSAEPCLADAADAGERDEARALPAHEVGERGELALATEERVRRGRDAPRRPGARRQDPERRVLREDRPLELPQRLARLDPELVDERLARALIDRERVRLPAGAVERQHQLSPEPLAHGLLDDEALELRDELAVPGEREVGVDPVLERGQSQLLEPRDLRLRERLPREVGERCAPPQAERGAQRLSRAGRVPVREPRPPLVAETDEPVEVDGLRVDDEPVARRSGLERSLGQELPQLGDVDLDRVARRVGRQLAPEGIDEAVTRDHLVRLEQQGGEEGTRLLPPQGRRLAVAADRKRPEEGELRRGATHPWVLARFQAGFSASSAGCAKVAP